MQLLTWAMLIAACSAGYLGDVVGLPSLVKFTPEMLSAVAALFVIVIGIQGRFRDVAGHYWLAFGLLVVTILCGIVANGVSPGPIVAGTRYYLRAIPFFLLPMVFQLPEADLKKHFKVVLAITLVQVPLAAYQRWDLLQREHFSGDGAYGTLLDASILCIFLLGVVLVLVGMLLRGQIAKQMFVLLLLIATTPMLINETKAVFILLPAGLFVTLLVGARAGQRLRIAAWAAALLTAFTLAFIPIYDYLNKDRPYAVRMEDFFTDSATLDRYLSTGTEIGEAKKAAGRLDALMIPLGYLAEDPVRFTFGLGLGNASHSALGTGFIGRYNGLMGPFVGTATSATFMLETGILGISLIFWLHWLIFRDCIAVARMDAGLFGALAIGWTGFIVVMSISLFYKQAHTADSIAYLFWFFSGAIAARRMQLTRQARQAPAVAASGIASTEPAGTPRKVTPLSRRGVSKVVRKRL